MNKEELIAKLKERFEYVSPITFPKEKKAGITGLYIIDVLDKIDETTAVKKLIKFYIKDLNMDTEEVIFDGWNPLTQPSTKQTFTQEVRAYTKSLIDKEVYEYIIVDDVNEELERALCRAYKVETDGTLTEKAIIVYKDDTSNITHKEATMA